MSTDAGRQHEMELALNSLISTLLDSQKGFADIGEHLKDETLKRYFLAESLKRASFRGDLEEILHQNGVHDIKESGTTGGTIHRVWGDLKAKLGGGDHTLLRDRRAGRRRSQEGLRRRARPGSAAARAPTYRGTAGPRSYLARLRSQPSRRACSEVTDRRLISSVLISCVIQPEHDHRSHQAINSEQVPAALFQPTAEPLQRHQPGQERKHRAEQTSSPCCHADRSAFQPLQLHATPSPVAGPRVPPLAGSAPRPAQS